MADSQQDGYKAARQAIALGDGKALRLALDQDRELVMARDRLDATLLMHAAVAGFVDGARLLVQRGADVNAQSGAGVPVLSMAAHEPACLDVLLAAGANVKQTDNLKQTALFQASKTGQVRSLERLLAAGAVVDARCLRGHTPFLWACANQKIAAMDALLGAGANLHARTAHGRNGLMLACIKGRVQAAAHLLSLGIDPHARDTAGDTALSLAQSRDRPDLAALLEAWLLTTAKVAPRSARRL